MPVATGLFLGFLLLQRFIELVIARRNTARLLAQGGYEVGAGHDPAMVALHAVWLSCIVVFGHSRPVSWPWLALFAGAAGVACLETGHPGPPLDDTGDCPASPAGRARSELYSGGG